MKGKILTLLLFCSVKLLGQAVPTDQIESRLDSIVKEADMLYSYVKSTETTEQIAKDSSIWIEGENSILSYRKKNLLINLLLNEKDEVVMKFIYTDSFSVPVFIDTTEQTLDEVEISLLSAKMAALQKAADEKRIINDLDDGLYYDYVFIPRGNQYKLYILSRTDKKNTIAFGRNYLMTFNKEDFDNYRLDEYKHSVEFMELSDDTKILVLNYSREMPLIHAVDILKFNLKRHNDQQALWVYSQRNRRTFAYNPKSNQVVIQ